MQLKIMKIHPLLLLFLIYLGLFSSSIYSIPAEQQELFDSLPPALQAQALSRMEEEQVADYKGTTAKEQNKIQSSLRKISDKEREADAIECAELKCIFGYEIFRDSPISFVSTMVAPITSSYLLGPGDILRISYFGSYDRLREAEIDNNGNYDLPLLGPVNISGLNIEKAQQIISEKVEAELIGTKASISLTEFRSITVFILGEANQPGSYTVSSFSTVTNALFSGGGVSKMGSLRNIKINRGGKLIASYDFYDFLLKGDSSSDIRLQDGDIIFIPFIENKVHLEGPFKRPATYEFVEGNTLAEAIDFAGGFRSPLEGAQRLGISSISQEDYIRINKEFSANDMPLNRLLINGDLITINGLNGFQKGSIELKGEVRYPGVYSFIKGERLLSVINRAGGYTEFSFSEGAVFTREEVAKKQKEGFERTATSLEQTIVDMVTTGDNITEFSLKPINNLIGKLRSEIPIGRQVIDANLLSIKQDPFKNFTLRDGDMLLIPQRPQYINIVGEVLNPNTLVFNPGLSVMDYLASSGGLTEAADEEKIFVIRPNGSSFLYKRTLFKNTQNLLPGSTVVVPRDSKPFDAVKITQIITPILADLATSAAAIAAISD